MQERKVGLWLELKRILIETLDDFPGGDTFPNLVLTVECMMMEVIVGASMESHQRRDKTQHQDVARYHNRTNIPPEWLPGTEKVEQLCEVTASDEA